MKKKEVLDTFYGASLIGACLTTYNQYINNDEEEEDDAWNEIKEALNDEDFDNGHFQQLLEGIFF